MSADDALLLQTLIDNLHSRITDLEEQVTTLSTDRRVTCAWGCGWVDPRITGPDRAWYCPTCRRRMPKMDNR